jgi:hypothetical protein
MSRRKSSSNESYDSSSSSVERKSKKRKSSQSTASKRKHPSFKYMITEAIYIQRKHIKGSSRPAIRNFILDNYDVDENRIKGYLSSNISKMLQDTEEGYPCLVRVDNNNYKLTPEWRKEWTKTNGIKPKTRKRKKRPAGYPKHPRNAYLYYSTDVRPKRQDEYPDKSFGDITKLVAEEWGKLSSKRKKKYVELAKKDTRRYKREMKEWNSRQSSSSESGSRSSSESEDRSKSRNRKRRATKSRSESEESKTQHSKKKQKRKNRSFTSSEESEEKGKGQKVKAAAENDEKKTSTERTELKASSDKTKNK